eukprot:4914045-Pleurochrysis_carterae.AAC.1
MICGCVFVQANAHRRECAGTHARAHARVHGDACIRACAPGRTCARVQNTRVHASAHTERIAAEEKGLNCGGGQTVVAGSRTQFRTSAVHISCCCSN